MNLQINSFTKKQAADCMRKLGNKRIICYGASTNYYPLTSIVNIQDAVEFFVDSDCKKWGQLYCGKEIKDPKEILQVDRETYMVLVLSSASADICRILETMGLEQGADYVTLSQLLDGRHELVRYINAANMLLDFLDTVPKELKDRKPDKGKGKIGIVMSIEGIDLSPDFPYSAALFLILKWKKYPVKLIVDNLCWTGDMAFYRGFSRDCGTILERLLCKLQEIICEDDVEYITAYDKAGMSEEDKRECRRIAAYSAQWQKWRRIQNFAEMSQELIEAEFAAVFEKNMGYVNAFFEHSQYDTVNVSTALHKRAGVIAYVCSKQGIQTSSQDGADGMTLLSADGAAYYGRDIKRTVTENWIPSDEKKKILKDAAEMAEQRFGSTDFNNGEGNLEEYHNMMKLKGYAKVSFQGALQNLERTYDVIIPLNAPYDGAAIGIHTFFESRQGWLVKTLDFIINKLGKTVLIREHPFLKMLPPSNYIGSDLMSADPDILEPYKDSPLLYYANYTEDINLYQYMRHCKAVLPWTSTVGVEAGLMRKNVVTHTDVYYADSAFAMRAYSEEEYFSFICKCLECDEWMVENTELAYEEALQYFYLCMNRRLHTKVTICGEDYHYITHQWLGMNFEELLKEKGVEEIVQIVAENIPSVYLTARQAVFAGRGMHYVNR